MSEQFEPHAELPPEPLLSEAETRRLVERLEAQIKKAEQLERAIATRPQPSAEPVAYLYEREGCKPYVTANRQQRWVEGGSTEEALVRASALEAARREALEQAAKLADEAAAENDRWKSIGKWTAKSIATAIRALTKTNMERSRG